MKELRLDIAANPLPSPKEFENILVELKDAEQSAEATRRGIQPDELEPLRPISDEVLSASEAFLKNLEEHAMRASRVLGELTAGIFGDLLVGQQVRWSQLAQDGTRILDKLRDARERLGNAQVEIPAQASDQQLLSDT